MSRGLSHQDYEEVFSQRLLNLEQRLRTRALYFARGDHDDAEDLFQEICIRLWEKSGSFRGDGSFAAWAFRVGDRVCLNDRRHRHRLEVRVPITEALTLTANGGPDADLDACSRAERQPSDFITDHVLALPPRLRSIVIMRYWLGWKAPRIARTLHLAIPSVWTALSQARGILRRASPPPPGGASAA